MLPLTFCWWPAVVDLQLPPASFVIGRSPCVSLYVSVFPSYKNTSPVTLVHSVINHDLIFLFNVYLFIELHWVLVVAACRIFSCNM